VERLYRERLAGPAVAVLRIVQSDVLHPQRGAAFVPHAASMKVDLARLIHKAPAGGHVVSRLLESRR